MGAILFDIVFVAMGAIAGGVAGWLIRASGWGQEQGTPEDSSPQSDDVKEEKIPVEDETPDVQEVEAILGRLHQLTASVAADVGEHQVRVQEINNELSASESGELNVVSAIERLIRANEAMQTQLTSAETRLQTQAEEIETHVREAHTDALTKLANRRAFDDELARCVEAYRRHGRPSCLMLLDVDHFKKFNDTYGHQAGDEVLRGVARTLRSALTGKEVVCRYGGEEFAVIFPDLDVASARAAAIRAQGTIAQQTFEFEELDLRVTASGGLAQLMPDEGSSGICRRADEALYAAKHNGRNRGYWHDGAATHPLTDMQDPQTNDPPQLSASEEPSPVEPPNDPPPPALRKAMPDLSTLDSFLADLDRRIAEWKRGGAPITVILVELDKFAEVSEVMGDKAAEVAVRAVAQFLKASMREMDHVAQIESGSFGLLLPGARWDGAGNTAERIRQGIERCSLSIDGEPLSLTISLGLTDIGDGDARNDLMERARTSLEAAKQGGGNCSYVATKADGCRPLVTAASV
jgi:diguanylate cyclase